MNSVKLLAATAVVLLGSGASMALADGDVAKGEKVYKKCKACHTAEEGGKNKVGPNLFGIVGRKAATVDGFKYSSAMEESGLEWTEANLNEFLKKPKAFLKGTKMSFAGVKKDSQREDLIAYLKTLK